MAQQNTVEEIQDPDFETMKKVINNLPFYLYKICLIHTHQ